MLIKVRLKCYIKVYQKDCLRSYTKSLSKELFVDKLKQVLYNKQSIT